MTLLHLKLTIGCLLGLFLATVIAVQVGFAQPPNRALSDFIVDCNGQPITCWHGIIPGVTYVAEAERLLTKLGYVPFRRSSYGIITYGRQAGVIPCELQIRYADSTAPIIALHFYNCEGIAWGDVVSQLHTPDTIVLSPTALGLRYRSHTQITLKPASLSLLTPVTQIELIPDVPIHSTLGIPWRGLRPIGLYCLDQRMLLDDSNC